MSARYPLIEAVCAALFVAAAVSHQPLDIARLMIVWLVAIVLLSLSVIDLEHRRLPNGLVLIVFVLALSLAIYDRQSVTSMIVGGGVMLACAVTLRLAGTLFLFNPGIGWGDVKLAAAIGVGIGSPEWPLFLSVLAVSLMLSVIISFGIKPISRQAQIPIGPALCVSAFAAFV